MEAFAGFVPDLMDRSKPAGVRFCTLGSLADAEEPALLVDLSRSGALDAAVAAVRAGKRVLGFTNHVARDVLDAATAGGVEAMPRSELFRRWPAV